MKKTDRFNFWFNAFILVGMLSAVLYVNIFKAGSADESLWKTIIFTVGAVMGVCNTVLSANGNILTFVFGVLDVVICAWTNLDSGNIGIFLQHILYFLPMQFVGLAAWRRRGGTSKEQVHARRLTKNGRLLFSGLFLVGLIAVYVILCAVHTETGATFAERLISSDGGLKTLRWIILVDALATVCNIIGQYLLSTAYMEQWFFWIVVNISSVIMWSLTASRDVATGQSASLASIYIVKYAFYLVNALNGLRIWLALSKPSQAKEN